MTISAFILIFKLVVTLLALLGKFKVRDFWRFCVEKGVHEVAVCTRWSKLLLSAEVKRVFSSVKRLITTDCNRLQDNTSKVLQLLKYWWADVLLVKKLDTSTMGDRDYLIGYDGRNLYATVA
jgi:hypothetical protein